VDYARYYLANLMVAAGIAGFALGGAWVWAGAATLPVLVIVDLFASRRELATRVVRHPRLADVPLYLHAILLVGLIVTAAIRAHAGLEPFQLAGVVATLAWLGVMPNIPIAHELLHRRARLPRTVAFLCAAAIGDPLRRLAHLRGHHVKLGRDDDSDTARRGESIYAFMIRAAIGGSREAFATERTRLAQRKLSVWSLRGDVSRSILLMASVLAAIGYFAGAVALATLTAGFFAARLLLESFNYLQHYGIVRAPGAAFGPRHSWSHLTPVVRAAAFEITNHPHHHADQTAPYWSLVPDPSAPQMPSALVCFLAALIPPVWERWIAKPLLRDWDERFASPEERVLAMRANRAAGWPAWLEEKPRPRQSSFPSHAGAS
jgi:alkane 1-monooxygenase